MLTGCVCVKAQHVGRGHFTILCPELRFRVRRTRHYHNIRGFHTFPHHLSGSPFFFLVCLVGGGGCVCSFGLVWFLVLLFGRCKGTVYFLDVAEQ